MALNSRQLKAVELLVYTDKAKQDIAIEVGVKPATLSVWLNNEEFQAALQKEMQRSFGYLATKAKRRLEQLLNSNQDSVAFAAAKEILNKAGYQETHKVEQDMTMKTQIINLEITEDE